MIAPTSIMSPRVASSDPSGSSSTGSQNATGTTADPLAQEQTFLQLLVAQVQNQDPMNPSTDPTEYVTELAQFSSLEQLTQIHGDLDTLVSATGPSTGGTTSTQEQS